MNKLIIIIGLVLLGAIPFNSSAQLAQPAQKTTYGQFKTVEDADYYIKAVDQKVAYVKANPEEDKKAKESGWYVQMAASRKDAIEQREKLLKEQKK
jgi:hypothetical protein